MVLLCLTFRQGRFEEFLVRCYLFAVSSSICKTLLRWRQPKIFTVSMMQRRRLFFGICLAKSSPKQAAVAV